MTPYFKGLDTRRGVVETRAFYHNSVQNGWSLKLFEPGSKT